MFILDFLGHALAAIASYRQLQQPRSLCSVARKSARPFALRAWSAAAQHYDTALMQKSPYIAQNQQSPLTNKISYD